MKKIVLISCVSKKRSIMAPASEMYISTLFNFNLRLAQKLEADHIFILSAKYGLLSLDEEIMPYDLTLNQMGKNERIEWAGLVLRDLQKYLDLQKDHFVILAGKRYRENIIQHIKSYEIPMEGLRIGEQLQFLKRQLKYE